MEKKLNINDYDLKSSTSKKDYNSKLFDVVAPKYDIITIILSFGRDRAWKRMLIKRLKPVSSPRCLDLACGTGDITFLLDDRFNGATITGLDLNLTMLKIAGERVIKRYGERKSISFENGDMCSTGKKDASFDIITGSYALRNAPDIGAALNEIYRILAPGGQCAFLDFSKSSLKIIRSVQLFLLKFWGDLWGLIMHGNPEIYGYIARSLRLYPERKQLDELIKKAGFINVKRKLLFFGYIEILTFEK